jgi:sulfide:quinone oxidoreductase
VPAAERPRVLIAGGGVAALEAVLALHEIAGDALDLTLVSARTQFEYGPLSVAEPFGLGRAHRFELAELLGDRVAELRIDSLEEVDVEGRVAHTAAGVALPYDALLIAIGARKQSGLPGAITFSGARATADVRRLLGEAEDGRIGRLAFAVPAGVTWSLPIYELALMSAARFAEGGTETEVAIVTPERRPVDAFGGPAGDAVAEMLEMRGVAFHSAVPARTESGWLMLEHGESIAADAVVALPRLDAPRIPGLAADENGFVPVDPHGRVRDTRGIYAAGDVTDSPLKQGGLAAQQADAAAEAIAADLGESIDPRPFRPVLRGLLLTGRAPRFLRAEVMRGRPTHSAAEPDPVWWPPAKISGRRLGPLLALHGAPGGPPPGAVALELDAAPDR